MEIPLKFNNENNLIKNYKKVILKFFILILLKK